MFEKKDIYHLFLKFHEYIQSESNFSINLKKYENKTKFAVSNILINLSYTFSLNEFQKKKYIFKITGSVKIISLEKKKIIFFV